MPVKIARSAPRPSFGLPELLVAIQPRVSLAARPEKREYLRQFGSHPGNPGLSQWLHVGLSNRSAGDAACEGGIVGDDGEDGPQGWVWACPAAALALRWLS
jgi:hypothetical protein